MSNLSPRIQALRMRRTDEMSGDYVLDPTHSRIGFVTRHAMVTRVRGQFNTFAGRVRLDFEDPGASSADLTIEVASVDTRDPHRDEHLRTNDFFDAPRYPTIAFRSSGIEQVEPRLHRVSGDLTIKATTRPVTFDLEYVGRPRTPSAPPAWGSRARPPSSAATTAWCGTRRWRPAACSSRRPSSWSSRSPPRPLRPEGRPAPGRDRARPAPSSRSGAVSRPQRARTLSAWGPF